MKVKNLFEMDDELDDFFIDATTEFCNRILNASPLELKGWDWILAEVFTLKNHSSEIQIRNFLDIVKKNKNSKKFSIAILACQPQFRKSLISPNLAYLDSFGFNGNELSADRIYFENTELLDDPPFKIKRFDVGSISIHSPRQTLINFLPEQCEMLEISILNSEQPLSFSGIHNRLKQCDELSINFVSAPARDVLGLLKIRGLQKVVFKAFLRELEPKINELNTIINKYLPEGDLLDCQEELIDAGLEEYAKL